MLPLIARGARAGGASAARAGLQLQARRWLNIHEYQGAQLMAKFGINVPEGAPATTVAEVAAAAARMKDAAGEVRTRESPGVAQRQPAGPHAGRSYAAACRITSVGLSPRARRRSGGAHGRARQPQIGRAHV